MNKMIRLWMAEGFLQGDGRNGMEAVGDNYFKHLLQSSLFQDVKRDDIGNIVDCSMHSYVHKLACTISGTRSIHEGNPSTHMQHVRYVGRNSADTYFPSNEQAKCLRTFILNGRISDKFLGFNYLHTLTLSNSYLEELPAGIEKLIHLRFLDLAVTNIKRLPGSICKLFNLQTLYAPICLEEFPNRFTDLICLRHLVFTPVKLPPRMGRLTCLQTLKYYRVGTEKGCTIAELGKLENLKGKLHIEQLESVKDKAEAERANLFGKENVYNLVLNWCGARPGETNDEKVLEGLQPQPKLKSLEIHGYEGNNFPFWTMWMEVRKDIQSCGIMLEDVTSIKLVNCRRCEKIPTLGHLPHLKFLELSNLPNVQTIGPSFYGYENSSNTSTISSNISFRSLQHLELKSMSILTDWVDAEGNTDVFPCLSHMEITSCEQLKSVPCHFPCLEELYLHGLGGDFPLSNICSNTTSLEKLYISFFLGLIHLPEGLIVKNEKLWYLRIKSCPSLTRLVPSLLGGGASLRVLKVKDCEKLSELPDDLDTLHSLETLKISKCPRLKSIPGVGEGSRGLFTLLRLKISLCIEASALLETCASTLSQLELSNLTNSFISCLETLASTLSQLELSNLNNLETSSLISCLPRMSCLVELDLSCLPKLVTFPTEISRNLRKLKIGGYSDSMDQVSFTHNLNRLLHHQHHLEDLYLCGKDSRDVVSFSFTQNLNRLLHHHLGYCYTLPAVDTQHLTNLRWLTIDGFDIETLPEWIGNISSLQQLLIWGCKSLKHMPSKEAMQRLTNLSVLQIVHCPLMKESFESNDSEWAKVSHIEEVEIDYKPFTRTNHVVV